MKISNKKCPNPNCDFVKHKCGDLYCRKCSAFLVSPEKKETNSQVETIKLQNFKSQKANSQVETIKSKNFKS